MQIDALDSRQLDVLRALDRHARRASTRLLRRYVEGNAQLQVFHRRDWSAALRLSQSFAEAYQLFWRQIRDAADDYWLPHAHHALFQLLHHRQVELLLRFIRYKKRIPSYWTEIHEIYKFALAHDIARVDVAAGLSDTEPAKATTLEQRYIKILLLDALNSGQLSPREGLWADAWLSRWCRALRLQSRKEKGAVQVTEKGFVVDLDATDGLKRAVPSTAANALFLDTSPLKDLIARGLRSLEEAESRADTPDFAARAGQIALLEKLGAIVAPTPARIKRRGERDPVAMTVEGIAGFADVAQVLRAQAMSNSAAGSMQDAAVEGITVSPLGAERFSSPLPTGAGIDPGSIQLTEARVVVPRAWQVKDVSESGCRMRGQIEDLNQVIPGSLIATRESAHAPWVVSVVRRFRRLMVDYVEIGVEYIGRRPRLVKLAVDGVFGPTVNGLDDANNRCIAALYLPPSEERPTMPIKTLLLPARYFKAECTVTLLSANANYTLRLGRPIRQQFEFVCVPFTVLHKQVVSPA
ncbi:MAG TPA: hypothetical protein VMN56_08910 [Casimicrobiaceae bacterium]|nr:hypothetical protein [Casimicrobiaceae bacterium]